jgi:ParB-like chromosome segregation protein Spo0J
MVKLKLLHLESSLSYGKLSTQELIDSLKPGQIGSLKVRSDGTVIDGHHRLKILKDRGVDINTLPREIIPRNTSP